MAENGARVGRPVRWLVRAGRLRDLAAAVQPSTDVAWSAAGRGHQPQIIVLGVGGARALVRVVGDPLSIGRPGGGPAPPLKLGRGARPIDPRRVVEPRTIPYPRP